jgi:type I restriction enzyme S subunit
MADVNSSKQHWTKVKFGDVVRLSKERSSDPLADGYERYIGLEHIEPEDLRVRRWGNVSDGVTLPRIQSRGQVLFGKRRLINERLLWPILPGSVLATSM